MPSFANRPSHLLRPCGVARDPELASDRRKQDEKSFKEIKRVYKKSKDRYGARKVWHQLRREKKEFARCTVERLMREHGLRGITRGKKGTTI